MKVWHDDTRSAPEGWERARTNIEAIALLLTDDVEEISLDHDLGADDGDIFVAGHSPDGTGYDLVRWMIDNDAVPPKVTVHSLSYHGRWRMANALADAGHAVTVRPFTA